MATEGHLHCVWHTHQRIESGAGVLVVTSANSGAAGSPDAVVPLVMSGSMSIESERFAAAGTSGLCERALCLTDSAQDLV